MKTLIIFKLILIFLIGTSLYGTVLIDPAGGGGFESGSTFAENGWTAVNGTSGNYYFVGAVPGAYAGSNCAFTSGWSTVWEGHTQDSFRHIYRDVSFPAGETAILLTFYYKIRNHEPANDRFVTFLTDTSYTPVTTGLPNYTTLIGTPTYFQGYDGAYYWVRETIVIPASNAGTTKRLVFSWSNSYSTKTGSGALDNISLSTSTMPAAISGVKTIDPSGSGVNNYKTFSEAVLALNLSGIGAGGVTFNVAAGSEYYENLPGITATGTASNRVTFQKSGSGANPKIFPSGSSIQYNSGIKLVGVSYYTFDGIDIDGTLAPYLNYGYYVTIGATNIGAKYNTIKNMDINLSRELRVPYTVNVGITQAGAGAFEENQNNYNKYYNFSIRNATAGVIIHGGDFGNEIGTTSPLIRNTFTNIGTIEGNSDYSESVYGIYLSGQNGVKVFNNDISGVFGYLNHATGIYYQSGSGTGNEIYNNKISNVSVYGSTTLTNVATGIRANSNSSGTDNVRIYNNFISNLYSSYNSTNTGITPVKGIHLGGMYGYASHSYDVDNNSVSIGSGLTPLYNNTCIEYASAESVYRVRGNIFANFTNDQPNNYYHNCVRATSGNIGAAGTVMEYNDYFIQNYATLYNIISGSVGYVLNGNYMSSLWMWKAFTTGLLDETSFSADPQFVNNNTDLHTFGAAMNDVAGFVIQPWITHDIDGEYRNSPADIGADEYDLTARSSYASEPATQVPGSVFNTTMIDKPVFKFTLTDSGNDGLATKVTNIRIKNANPANSASWADNILLAYIRADGEDAYHYLPAIANDGLNFLFPAGSLIIPSEGSKNLTLSLVLKNTGVQDGKNMQFMISRTAHGFSSDTSGTLFLYDFGADIVSNVFNLDVVASKFTVSAPASVLLNSNFPVTVSATDATGNIDTNFTGSVTLAVHTGSGTISSVTGLTQALVNSTYTWNNIKYNATGTFKIKASGTLADGVSNDINSSSSVTIGTGTSAQPYPFNAQYGYARSAAIYTSSEIGAFGNLVSMSWFVSTAGYDFIPVKVYLKKTTDPQVLTYPWNYYSTGSTLVYNGSMRFSSSGWATITFSSPFNYDSNNLLVLVEANFGGTGAGSYPQFAYTVTTNNMYTRNSQNTTIPTDTFSLTANTWRPNVKINFQTAMQYASSTTTQNDQTPVSGGAVNQQIIGVQVVTEGTLSSTSINSLSFNTTGTTNVSNIVNAKVFSTGNSNVFGTSSQYGSTITNLGAKGAFTVSGTQALLAGTNYFWLTYDLAADIVVGNALDAQCTSVRVANVDYTPSVTNPAGNRLVVGKKVSSVNIYQMGSGTIANGTDNVSVLQIDFYVVEGSDAQSFSSLPLNSILVTGKNTNNSDISAVKLYTGTGFANPLGTALTLAAGTANFTGLNYELPIGSTSILVYYNIAANATVGNTVDAKITANAINVKGITYPATEQDPSGNYTIQNVNFGAGYAAQGGYYFANTLADTAPSKPTFNWIDITSTGTNSYPDMSGDSGAAPNNTIGYDLGFSFPYYGQTYTKFWIGADGAIYFLRPTFPPPMGINPAFIALYSADFHPANPNYPKTVLYQKVGDTMVITYLKCQSASVANPQDYFTGQIILYPTGKIKLQYLEKGSLTSLNNGFVAIGNQTITAYHLYNQGGTGGPLFGDSPIAVAYGQNAYMLSDNAAQNDLPVAATGTPTINFPITGATVQFTTSTAATNLTAIRVETNPGGALPVGILSLANTHWTINSTATSGLGNYNLTLNLSGITSLNAETVFYLVKREHVNSAWANMGAPSMYDFANRTATWQLSNGFSDFGLGFEENETLPVELTSFMAQPTATNNAVTLTWTTQSETGLNGYYVYRNTSDELSDAISINQLIPAENSSAANTYRYTDNELEGEGTYYYWLQSVELDGSNQFFGPVTVTIEADEPTPPVTVLETRLKNIFPNPFNPTATISYSLKEAGSVRLEIFNSKGQSVKTQDIPHDKAGNFSYNWNAENLGSGLYIVRFTQGKHVQLRKAILSK